MINAFGKSYPIREVIGEITKENSTKAVVFLGGIHGNEPSGYSALMEVFPRIVELESKLKGDVYALGGNLNALKLGKRFIKEDLNRIWLHKNIDKLKSGEINSENADDEWRDFLRLHQKIRELLDSGKELYVLDLHTTSSESVPFITINDQISNRDYSRKFPVPIILGIEEYLSGPLLSYMNEFGHVSMAFEAGQHDSQDSVRVQEAFIWLSLIHAGILEKKDIDNYDKCLSVLSEKNDIAGEIFEVRFKKSVVPEEDFSMRPGYFNFKHVRKNEVVASNNSGEIKTNEGGRIFMPLYQKEGNDGFFLIRRVPKWALTLSKTLRRTNFESILTILPGVNKVKGKEHVLSVNPRIAKFLSTDLFHLLGYRRKTLSKEGKMIFSRREITDQ